MFNKMLGGIRGTRTKLLNGLANIISDVGPLSFFSNWFNPNNLVGELEQLEKYTGITYACVSAIAEDVARIEFQMAKKNADGSEEAITAAHPFLDVLKNPNPTQSDYEFIEMTQTHIELTGEAFWYVPKGKITAKPKELWIMRPDLVQIVYDQETGEITGYIYHKWNGRVQIPLDLDEVVHFKMPNPINPYRGMGTVQAAIVYIQTEEYTSRYSRNYLANNATPAGVLNFKGTIPDIEFEKIKRQWRREYGDVQNAGKTAFLRNVDAEYKKIGDSLSDINITDLKTMTRDDIMFMFRVSKPILGITEDVNYASAKTAEYVFAKRVIDPKMHRIVDTIQTFYNLKYKDNLIVTYKSPIPQDNTEKIEYLKAAIGTGVPFMTLNEARATEGLEPQPGGDVLMIPDTYVPLAEAQEDNPQDGAAPKPKPADGSSDSEDELDDNDGGGDDDPKNNTGDDSNGDETNVGNDDKAPNDSTGDSVEVGAKNVVIRRVVLVDKAKGRDKRKTETKKPKAAKKKAASPYKPISLAEAAKENHRLGIVKMAHGYVPQVQHAIKEAVGKQRLKVLGQLVATGPQLKRKAADDNTENIDQPDPSSLDYGESDFTAQMSNNLMPILIELMQHAGQAATNLVDSKVQYVLSQQSIDRITARIQKLASEYSTQTQAALIETIKNGYTQGLGIGDMSDEIEGVFQSDMGYRATRVARTETMNEANAAANDAYVQLQVPQKEWYAGGANPCQFCESLDGEVIDASDNFVDQGDSIDGVDGGTLTADYSDIVAGNAHPNCECTILPVNDVTG